MPSYMPAFPASPYLTSANKCCSGQVTLEARTVPVCAGLVWVCSGAWNGTLGLAQAR